MCGQCDGYYVDGLKIKTVMYSMARGKGEPIFVWRGIIFNLRGFLTRKHTKRQTRPTSRQRD